MVASANLAVRGVFSDLVEEELDFVLIDRVTVYACFSSSMLKPTFRDRRDPFTMSSGDTGWNDSGMTDSGIRLSEDSKVRSVGLGFQLNRGTL